MEAIVARDAEAAQWREVLAVAQGEAPESKLSMSVLGRIYHPLVAARRENRPLVIGQIGQSLDGRVATASGHSHYINGPAAIVHLHRLRALVDAVVVGAGTVVADNPQLTVRHVEGTQPARVVIDPHGRSPAAAKFFAEDGVRRIVLGRDGRHPGTEFIAGDLAPRAIIKALQALGLNRVLVEGGPNTLSRFLEHGALDRLHVMVAPMILGSGKPGLELPAIAHLDQALRPAVTSHPLPGGDVLFDCDLRA